MPTLKVEEERRMKMEQNAQGRRHNAVKSEEVTIAVGSYGQGQNRLDGEEEGKRQVRNRDHGQDLNEINGEE